MYKEYIIDFCKILLTTAYLSGSQCVEDGVFSKRKQSRKLCTCASELCLETYLLELKKPLKEVNQHAVLSCEQGTLSG